MSKTWYPVINYEKCIECGACTDKCLKGVYDKDKAPKPIVILPVNCVHGCHGCGDLCPVEAISYVGETGQKSEGCCCESGDCSSTEKCC